MFRTPLCTRDAKVTSPCHSKICCVRFTVIILRLSQSLSLRVTPQSATSMRARRLYAFTVHTFMFRFIARTMETQITPKRQYVLSKPISCYPYSLINNLLSKNDESANVRPRIHCIANTMAHACHFACDMHVAFIFVSFTRAWIGTLALQCHDVFYLFSLAGTLHGELCRR